MTGARSKRDGHGSGPGAGKSARGAADKGEGGGTRERIAQDFVRLVAVRPLEKVSIAALVKDAGINRKTFYYHFSDKSDLVAWIFRSALARSLARDFGPDRLVRPSSDHDERYPDLPCSIDGDGHSRGLARTMASVMLADRDYYLHVLRDPEGAFARYLAWLYRPLVERDIERAAGGAQLSEAARSFLAGYAIDATVMMLGKLVERPLPGDVLSEVTPFVDVAYEGLLRAIEKHPSDQAD